MKTLTVVLMLLASVAGAQAPEVEVTDIMPGVPVAAKPAGRPYFRFISRSNIQQDAMANFKLKNRSAIGATTDIALITHSEADGSVIPEKLQPYIAPESWVPLQVGVGGSLTGNAIAHIGMSYNVGAQLANTITKITGQSSNPTAKAITDFLGDGLALSGGSTLGFAAALGIAAGVIQEGHFQSLRAMFPRQGFGPNLEDSACYSLGLAWKL